jgi:drug/metabolite transporter (DMT)-like permease
MLSHARLWPLVAAALVGFAGNSLLCRIALGRGHADFASFTALRTLSGALALFLLRLLLKPGVASRLLGTSSARTPSGGPMRPRSRGKGGVVGAAVFCAYAVAFSWAYLRIGAGVGALLLFGTTQATMLTWAIARGERPTPLEWLGILCAMGGLAALTLPGSGAPDLLGAGSMIFAGIGWGTYTLLGRRATDPLVAIADSFLYSVPFALALLLAARSILRVDFEGALYATISGALTSGVAYTFWYMAVPHLSAARAAILQLLVPLLASAGGIVLLDERPNPRLVACAIAILGGVALAVLSQRRR